MDKRVAFFPVVLLLLFALCASEKQEIMPAATPEDTTTTEKASTLETAPATTIPECPQAAGSLKAYREAEKAYGAGDCLNASRSAADALKYYTGCSDAAGIGKVNSLSIGISECLNQKAGAYYKLAIASFDHMDYDPVEELAWQAKTLYEAAGNDTGVRKCSNLISMSRTSSSLRMCGIDGAGPHYYISNCDTGCQSDADCKYACGCGAINVRENCYSGAKVFDCANEPVKCVEGKCVADNETGKASDAIKRTDNVYKNAIKFFEAGDYRTSRQLAVEAKKVYDNNSMPEGVNKCGALVEEIDKKIEAIREKADGSYVNGTRLFALVQENESAGYYVASLEGYKRVMTSALEAKKLYAEIGYESGYRESIGLQGNATRRISGMEGPLLSEANGSFTKGDSVVLSCKGKYGDAEKRACYDEALGHYQDARGIYEALYTFARDSGGCFERNSCKELTDKIESVNERIYRIALDNTSLS